MNITKSYSLFMTLCILMISIMLISGCSSEPKKLKCKNEVDCLSLSCAQCDKGFCEAGLKQNCCGNSRCEDATENKCSCTADCGACKATSNFMKANCEGTPKTCVIGPALDQVSRDAKSYPVSVSGSKLTIMPSFDVPFFLGYSTLDIRIKPDIIESTGKFLIKRIRVFEVDNRGTIKPIAEQDYNQVLYATESEFNEKIILPIIRNNSKTNEVVTLSKNIQIELQYDLITLDYYGNEVIRPQTFQRDIASNLQVVALPNSSCNAAACTDSNQCTVDSCQIIDGYSYCTHTYRAGCCGNKICEVSENKCSCATDCGACQQDYGKYISYSCSNTNICIPNVKTQLLERKTQRFNSISSQDISYTITVNYNQPHDIRLPMQIEYELNSKQATVSNITIQKIEILESGKYLLGEIKPVSDFSTLAQIISYSLTPELLSMTTPERALRPQIVTTVQYINSIPNYPSQTLIRKETINLDEIYFVKQ